LAQAKPRWKARFPVDKHSDTIHLLIHDLALMPHRIICFSPFTLQTRQKEVKVMD
jgi:hypothetical protein